MGVCQARIFTSEPGRQEDKEINALNAERSRYEKKWGQRIGLGKARKQGKWVRKKRKIRTRMIKPLKSACYACEPVICDICVDKKTLDKPLFSDPLYIEGHVSTVKQNPLASPERYPHRARGATGRQNRVKKQDNRTRMTGSTGSTGLKEV